MASLRTRILRVPRTDRASDHLLLNITKTGSKKLDVKLIGTDQEHLYHAQVKDSDAKSLQSSNYTGDLPEWISILSYVLFHETADNVAPEILRDVELVAAISKNTVTITIRKNVKGITQKLGALTLQQDDEREEVAAFDWVDIAVATSDDLRNQLQQLQVSVDSQKEQISRLSSQLDDLVRAKKDHEDELLSKFAALLNAKKLKIRDQQRLLVSAKVDTTKLANLDDNDSTEHRSYRPSISRQNKRRPDEDDGAEPGDADVDEHMEMQTETPEDSNTEGYESEGADLADNADKKADEATHAATSKNASQNSNVMDLDDPEEIPTRRTLPFAGRPRASEEPTPSITGSNVVHGEDDDETDDEL